MPKGTVAGRINAANKKTTDAHLSVSMQENQIKDALLVPGGMSNMRNSMGIVGEEVKGDGSTMQVVKRMDKTNTMLSLTNQIAHALKSN